MAKNKSEDKVIWVPRRITVSELRTGNRIVSKTEPARLSSLDDEKREELLMYFYTDGQPLVVSKSRKVDTIEECRGNWRTHIHVNGSNCYDLRCHVEIAVPL